MASKKKLKRKLATSEAARASNARSLDRANELLDRWEEFGQWMREHAPATVKRHVEMTDINMPLTRLRGINEILKHDYAPLLRDQLQPSSRLFEQFQQKLTT